MSCWRPRPAPGPSSPQTAAAARKPWRDQDALTAALERFLSLPWEQRCDMGRLGREKMEREFDRAIVADRYMQVLFPQKTITKERQAIGL